MKIAVIIYPGVELVDMNGPLDVFLKANSLQPGRYEIYTVAETKEALQSEGGIVKILPAYDFSDCPSPDVLIVPGLLDAAQEPAVASEACIAFIKSIMVQQKLILSVCIGLFNVAATGLLSGKRVTTHYQAIKGFQEQHRDILVIKNERVVRDGLIVSTGGVTSGIDGALSLLETFDGSIAAQQVADIMVYNRKALLPEYTLLPPYET